MKKINNVLVTGCSATSGYNYQENPDDSRLWIQRICNRLFPDAKVVNRARTGKNNQWIFLETMSALCKNRYDLVIVQWSSLMRLHMTFGLETWMTDSLLVGDYDIHLHNGVVVSKKWQKSLGNNIRSMSNQHWYILDLIKYVNVLIQIQESRNQKIIFINGGLLWPDGLFDTQKNLTQITDMLPFVQHMLDVDSRSDEEIFKLYDMIYDQYAEYGSIRPEYWINLYESMHELKIDTISDTDSHHGEKSQIYFADLFSPRIQQKLENN
jgi:hypothetical protein